MHGKTRDVIDLRSLWQWLGEMLQAMAEALDPGDALEDQDSPW